MSDERDARYAAIRADVLGGPARDAGEPTEAAIRQAWDRLEAWDLIGDLHQAECRIMRAVIAEALASRPLRAAALRWGKAQAERQQLDADFIAWRTSEDEDRARWRANSAQMSEAFAELQRIALALAGEADAR